MFVSVKYYPTYWCVFDVARSEVSLKAAHYQLGVHHRPGGGVFADLAGKDRDKDRVGACCADRERCEQDGEQTAPPVLHNRSNVSLPPSFEAMFLPTTIRRVRLWSTDYTRNPNHRRGETFCQ
jgi:hypothetical protein